MPGITGFLYPARHYYEQSCAGLMSGSHEKTYDLKSLFLQINGVRALSGYAVKEIKDRIFILYGHTLSVLEQESSDLLDRLADKKNDIDAIGNIVRCVNGYYCLIILDKTSHNLQVITDRYGVKPLYLWEKNGRILGISSECKALAIHPDFDGHIDIELIHAYQSCSHLLEDKTLYKNIRRIPPACMLSINCYTGEYTSRSYWRWSELVKSEHIDFNRAVDKAHDLWVQAIQRCLKKVKSNQLSIPLSGGLDSRVILAETQRQFNGKIKTFTFGIKGSDDVTIAKSVSKKCNIPHSVFYVSEKNWMDAREEAVWHTDGLLNYLHTHLHFCLPEMTKHSPFMLSGFLGDVVFGGSYLIRGELDSYPSESILQESPALSKVVENIALKDPYYQFAGSDPLHIYNRGVRFISMGSDMVEHHGIEPLHPFMDNDLLEFLYSLPDNYREDSRLYRAMLIKYYPAYFGSIPWEKTGRVISKEETPEINNVILKKIVKTFKKKKKHVLYTKWLRVEASRSFVESHIKQCEDHCLEKVACRVRDNLESFCNKTNNKDSINNDVIGAFLSVAIFFNRVGKVKKHLLPNKCDRSKGVF